MIGEPERRRWWQARPSWRTTLGAVLFLVLLGAALAARVLWVRREIVRQTAEQLPRSLEAAIPALDVWRDGYVAQASLLARIATLESADRRPAKLGAALSALDPRRGIVGGWAFDANGTRIAGPPTGAPDAPRGPAALGAAHVATGVDAGGVHADIVAPEAAASGAVVLRVRVRDSTFAALNAGRLLQLGARTTLLVRIGDSVQVVATSGPDSVRRRRFALAEVPDYVRAALAGTAGRGTGAGMFGGPVIYAAAPVPSLGWAIVREHSTTVLFALVRPAIIAEESVFAALAIMLALTIVGIVRTTRAKRAGTLAQLRADFVGAVSHELRTPLAQIRLFAELLREGALRDPAEADRALGVIEKEAGRLSILVDNILSYTSLRRRQRFVTPLAADIAAEAKQVIESFAPLAAERGAKVVSDLEPNTRARIDTQALRQVLLNFLENAVKYGPKGQTVTVGARHVSSKTGAARVRVWVDDQGAGVPPGERAAVWNAFYRSEGAQRAGVGGSGLGLAVVHDLVEQYGGSAAVEDAPNGGARFVVELPGLRVS